MTRLFVGNLPYGIQVSALAAHLEQCGRVSEVKLGGRVLERRAWDGSAEVELPLRSDAENVLATLRLRDFEGRRLRIEFLDPNEAEDVA